MRFLLGIVDETGERPTDAERAAIEAFTAALRARGRLVVACGLADAADGVVVDATAGDPRHTPAAPGTGLLTGVWVVSAPDVATAHAIAADASAAAARRVEVRPFR